MYQLWFPIKRNQAKPVIITFCFAFQQSLYALLWLSF